MATGCHSLEQNTVSQVVHTSCDAAPASLGALGAYLGALEMGALHSDNSVEQRLLYDQVISQHPPTRTMHSSQKQPLN